MLEAGKIHSIVQIMKDNKIDILALTETHIKEPDQMNIMGYTVWHSADAERDEKGKIKQKITGVSIITSPRITPAITDIRPHSGRHMTMTIDTAQAPLKIIATYAPHNGHDQAIRDVYWEQFSTEILQSNN